MPTNQQLSIQGPEAFIQALRDPGRNLKERYKGDPLALAERLGVKLPRKPVLAMIERGVITEEEAKERFGNVRPGLRELVEDVCLLNVRSAVAVANRGGGKSFGVSFIEFYLWMILDFDALNLGGSELQADQVYRYILGYMDEDEFWLSLVKGEPQRERTFTTEDAWVRVLTASSKSVRSPHAGGLRKGKLRGGVLVIDEEAEAEKDIVESALPTINTARPSVNLRVSTFHNLEGSFQEVVDNHEEMGYSLYQWDIFDVAERCDCVGQCQAEEKCFREDHIEHYHDPDSGELKERLLHRAYSFLGQEIVFVRCGSGSVENTTLESLYERFDDGSGAEIIDVPPGWEIFDTVTPPGRWESNVQWTPLLAVSRHKPKVALRTIQAGSGDAITVTDDHPFMVTRDRQDTFVAASEVALGDNCVIPNVVKHLSSKSFSLDQNVAYLIGQYLAEGNMGINARKSKWVTLSGLRDPESVVKAASIGDVSGYRVRAHSGRGWNVHFGAEFYDLLTSLGLGHETALNKRMPVNIMEWDESSTAALLCGLIDGDGSIHHTPEREHFNALSSVSLRVASKALVSQAQLCLRKLGMSGWVRYVGYYDNSATAFNQNFPLYGLEFSVREDKIDLFSMSEKIGNGMWPRTRNYAKPTGSRQKQVRSIKQAELGEQEFVYDVTTGSQTFWCSGFRTHNCGGRAMYADGWIPLEEITTLWKRMRRNHSRWEVEAMGSRPSTAGFAVKDLNQFASNIVPETGEQLYLPGAPVEIDVDWGTGAAGICVWQSQPGGKEVLLHADLVKDNNQTQMNGIILGYASRYARELTEIAADIGGGGNYMNPSLRLEHRLPVRDVNFNEEKEAAVAAFNIKNEAGEVVIPAEHTEFVHQVRNWKRKNGRIQKGNDHLCDAGIVCHFSKFIDEMGLAKIRIAPRSFHSNPDVRETSVGVRQDREPGTAPQRRGRAPVVRTFGSRTRRR